jgi:cytidyltransferase-like protein
MLIEEKIIHLNEMTDVQLGSIAENLRIGLCHGTFDLLHPGHLLHFAECREFVDFLIVGLTSDRFIRKSDRAPLFSQSLRALQLASLSQVDLVVIVDNKSAVPLIEKVRPLLYFKGKDYAEGEDKAGNLKDEALALEKHGGQIYFTKTQKFSSTLLKQNLGKEMENTKPSFLNEIFLKDLEEKVKNVKVVIIGDSILDSYKMCVPLGKSSKHSLVAQRVVDQNTHLGGVLAVALQSESIGAKTTLITSFANRDSSSIISAFKSSTQIINWEVNDRITTRKIRFIERDTNHHLFEIYEFDETEIQCDAIKLEKVTENLREADVVILVDYGHGFFTNKLRNHLSNFSLKNPTVKFFANAQKNAGNQGFNDISNYGWCSSIVLNGSEVEVELRRRKLLPQLLIKELSDRLDVENILITLGAEGLIHKDKRGEITRVSGIPTESFVDKTGAGDTLLAFYSICLTASKDLSGTLEVANIAANLNIKVLANSKSVTFEDLRERISLDNFNQKKRS